MDTVNIDTTAGAAAPAEAQGIQVTDKAVAHIRRVLEQEKISPSEGGLRLGVQGGGCSGMSYVLRFESESDKHDKVFEFDGVRVFIDPKSYIYLRGMTLDFEETLMRQGFVFNNPNATKSCGCGTSFS